MKVIKQDISIFNNDVYFRYIPEINIIIKNYIDLIFILHNIPKIKYLYKLYENNRIFKTSFSYKQ